MDDREFLNKIRKIQGSDNKISLTEMTVDSVTPPFENKKKQLNRLLKESNLLNEDIQTLDAQEQKEEESKFKDIVSKLVKFEPIKVYPENVLVMAGFDGELRINIFVFSVIHADN